MALEGRAARVTYDATLQDLAGLFADGGWAPTVADGGFTHDYSAPSAGPPPWYVYEFTPEDAYAVATKEPGGATDGPSDQDEVMDVDVLLAGIPVGDLKAEQTRMPRRLDCDEFPPPSEVESVMRSDRQSADAVSDPNEGRVHSGDGGERQGFARRVAVNPRYFTVASDESRARFDLTQFDDAFFERLRRRVADAGDRGLSAPALVGRSCW